MYTKIKDYITRKRALYGLRKKYRMEIAVEKLSKDWITACIIDRQQEFRRKELIESQAKIKEIELFYKWLKSQK